MVNKSPSAAGSVPVSADATTEGLYVVSTASAALVLAIFVTRETANLMNRPASMNGSIGSAGWYVTPLTHGHPESKGNQSECCAFCGNLSILIITLGRQANRFGHQTKFVRLAPLCCVPTPTAIRRTSCSRAASPTSTLSKKRSGKIVACGTAGSLPSPYRGSLSEPWVVPFRND